MSLPPDFNYLEADARADARASVIAKMLLQAKESDRGCVIIGTAMVEDELELLLRAYCRNDRQVVKRVVDPLFRTYAPFSTLSGKIAVSFALGLIPENLHDCLTLLRKFRNDFAHEDTLTSFQTPKNKARLNTLFRLLSEWRGSKKSEEFLMGEQFHREYVEKVPHMGNLTKEQLAERVAFALAIMNILTRLEVARELATVTPRPIYQNKSN